MKAPCRHNAVRIRGAWIAMLVVAISQLLGCGYKGPLVAADPAAPADKSIATSRVPDAGSAAPPAAQDAERVIDESGADDETP